MAQARGLCDEDRERGDHACGLGWGGAGRECIAPRGESVLRGWHGGCRGVRARVRGQGPHGPGCRRVGPPGTTGTKKEDSHDDSQYNGDNGGVNKRGRQFGGRECEEPNATLGAAATIATFPKPAATIATSAASSAVVAAEPTATVAASATEILLQWRLRLLLPQQRVRCLSSNQEATADERNAGSDYQDPAKPHQHVRRRAFGCGRSRQDTLDRSRLGRP